MKTNNSLLLKFIHRYVSDKMDTVDAGHNMGHIERVRTNALKINKIEKADTFLVEAGALLHDLTDEKLFNKSVAECELNLFLQQIGLDDRTIKLLNNIIRSVSFGAEFDGTYPLTPEQKVVRDADRLDALGAIGIARTFHYGGSRNRQIYNKTVAPQKYHNTCEYRNNNSPTINHFYEKLLLLKDRMETSTGKKMALQRHSYMILFLKQFYLELGEEGFLIPPTK
ncbi:uncharacterized protein SAMN06265379_104316 [Saccharicrinis carchari]|uniref:HD/PDEase domain-containing protein n=1 Tax=Saccharicrinis carchari TaxID=1168039 RepID=A0A521D6Y3_SACCC|nr:HD domain-containing protein [Saccharicrinis carchari]SMO67457.1 uncharacterized protein SAMN06265379_104316 [Saccharicrinis carchari]